VLKNGLKVTCKVQVYALEVRDHRQEFQGKGRAQASNGFPATRPQSAFNEPELRDLFLLFKRRMTEQLARRLPKQIPAE
jgi:hypothetical protein